MSKCQIFRDISGAFYCEFFTVGEYKFTVIYLFMFTTLSTVSIQASQANTSVLLQISVYYFIYGFYSGYVGEYKYTVIGICLLFYLWFFIQATQVNKSVLLQISVYFISTVYIQTTQANKSVLQFIYVYYFIYGSHPGYVQANTSVLLQISVYYFIYGSIHLPPIILTSLNQCMPGNSPPP